VSKRTERRKANRRPYWNHRASRALGSGVDGAYTQYDLARTHIHKIAMLGERDREWRALAVTIAAFNTQFTGIPGPDAVADFQPTGRQAGTERSFKARHVPINAAAEQYDIARKYLRSVDDAEQQEDLWRQLETELRRFNERFSRDRTRIA
jgi:hypothetical protein